MRDAENMWSAKLCHGDLLIEQGFPWDVRSADQEIPHLYRTLKFITIFTTARHTIQSTPRPHNPTKLQSFQYYSPI